MFYFDSQVSTMFDIQKYIVQPTHCQCRPASCVIIKPCQRRLDSDHVRLDHRRISILRFEINVVIYGARAFRTQR